MYVGVDGETTHGGTKLYKDVAKDNSEIEEKIGLSLATNSEVPKLAKAIMTNSGAPTIPKGSVDPTKLGKYGGAQSVDEGWDTLGGSVFTVMEEIEKSADIKTEYSISSTEGHPYFPKGEKKKDFDKALCTLNLADLPADAKSSFTPPDNYNELSSTEKLPYLEKYRFSSPEAQGTADKLTGDIRRDMGVISTALNNFVSSEKEKADRDTLRDAILKEKGALDAKLGALLDLVVDKHTSGDHTNMVKRDGGSGDKSSKDRWIDDTVSAGKPIISGPSGHTLRYLNFWAEKRDEGNKAQKPVSTWPSLQAARLVMMADLMPPKHHSYDEIMTSSIGITDGASASLTYDHKSSYQDLAIQGEADAKDIARKAFMDSEAYKVKTDDDLDRESIETHLRDGISTVDAVAGMTWRDQDQVQVQARNERAVKVDARNAAGKTWDDDNQATVKANHRAAIEDTLRELKKLNPQTDEIGFAIRSLEDAIRRLG